MERRDVNRRASSVEGKDASTEGREEKEDGMETANTEGDKPSYKQKMEDDKQRSRQALGPKR